MIELGELQEQAEACTQCRLADTRTKVVFGTGSADSRVMVVGEAPGKNEDLEGLPFVGRAGQLLDRLMAEVSLSRDSVYITNVLKCRPPNNRDPQPDEVESCKGYLRQQIPMIEPEVVITLGNFATKLLLSTTTGITRMRGQAYPWWLGSMLVPTFHPAAALRGGEKVTSMMRDDFKLARTVLDAAESGGTAGQTGPEGFEQDRLWE